MDTKKYFIIASYDDENEGQTGTGYFPEYDNAEECLVDFLQELFHDINFENFSLEKHCHMFSNGQTEPFSMSLYGSGKTIHLSMSNIISIVEDFAEETKQLESLPNFDDEWYEFNQMVDSFEYENNDDEYSEEDDN